MCVGMPVSLFPVAMATAFACTSVGLGKLKFSGEPKISLPLDIKISRSVKYRCSHTHTQNSGKKVSIPGVQSLADQEPRVYRFTVHFGKTLHGTP